VSRFAAEVSGYFVGNLDRELDVLKLAAFGPMVKFIQRLAFVHGRIGDDYGCP
jgi:hypothetical protein